MTESDNKIHAVTFDFVRTELYNILAHLVDSNAMFVEEPAHVLGPCISIRPLLTRVDYVIA